MASVWVPFTSESKEAVASYPEIQKELRLGLQAVGRKLGMYLRRRNRVKHEGQRRALRVDGDIGGQEGAGGKADHADAVGLNAEAGGAVDAEVDQGRG